MLAADASHQVDSAGRMGGRAWVGAWVGESDRAGRMGVLATLACFGQPSLSLDRCQGQWMGRQTSRRFGQGCHRRRAPYVFAAVLAKTGPNFILLHSV
jgi:hypothetical protein